MANRQHHSAWTFLSNHTHVLYCISTWPDIRIRDIALQVRITERAVQRIVVDLERAGYLKRERVGRQNRYRLEPGRHLRHPLEHHVEIGRLLKLLQPRATSEKSVANQGSAVVAERGPIAVRSRADAKATSRLKKRQRSSRR